MGLGEAAPPPPHSALIRTERGALAERVAALERHGRRGAHVVRALRRHEREHPLARHLGHHVGRGLGARPLLFELLAERLRVGFD